MYRHIKLRALYHLFFSCAARATHGWWWLQEESAAKSAAKKWPHKVFFFFFKSNKKISTDDAFEILNNIENTGCSSLPLRPEDFVGYWMTLTPWNYLNHQISGEGANYLPLCGHCAANYIGQGVNDDCFDLLAFANRKFQLAIRKKSFFLSDIQEYNEQFPDYLSSCSVLLSKAW